MRTYFNRQTLIAALFCPVLFLLVANFEFNQPKLFKSNDFQYTPQFFRFISFGYWPAMADLMWIQTLQKIGLGEYTKDKKEDAISFYRLATSLDPNFYEIYDQAGIFFSFYFEDPSAAIEFLDKGIQVFETGHPPEKFWTHPYTLYMYKAYIYAFLKDDWKAAKESYLKAAEVKGVPSYIVEMKSWLQKEGSEKKLAIKVLTLMMKITKDPVVKAKYLEKLKKYE